jgi:gas vesicle protein
VANQQRSKDLLIGAVVGGVIGAITALLIAPKSGAELRSDISNQVNTVSDKTQQAVQAVTHKTQEIVKAVGSQTSEWIGKTKETAKGAVVGVRSWREGRKEEPVEEGHVADFEILDDLPVLVELKVSSK